MGREFELSKLIKGFYSESRKSGMNLTVSGSELPLLMIQSEHLCEEISILVVFVAELRVFFRGVATN